MTIRTLYIAAAAAAATVTASAAPARAHTGPRVWLGNVNGKITTYSSNNDAAPTVYTPNKVFVAGVDEDTLQANGRLDEYPVEGTGIFATDFPGYQVRPDRAGGPQNGGIAFETTFAFATAGPLLVFDPSRMVFRTTQQAFGNPGPAPQMGLSPEGGQPTVTGNGPVDGADFYSYAGPTDHGHLNATLLPDGTVPSDGSPPGDGPHVVYLVPMKLTAPGYADSLPYSVLYGRDVGYLADGPNRQLFLDAVNTARTSIGFPGDANLDGRVDVTDLGVLATHFNGDGFWTDGDFNNSGTVDVTDLGVLATNFNQAAAGQSFREALRTYPQLTRAIAVPEPASASLLAFATLGLLARRRFTKVK
jgi:hypothetical protein